MTHYLKIDPADTVAVALKPLAMGTVLDDLNLILSEDIPRGHKFALCDHHEGDQVIKYGGVIGQAQVAIKPGAHVHIHNIRTTLVGARDYLYNGPINRVSDSQIGKPATFQALSAPMAKSGSATTSGSFPWSAASMAWDVTLPDGLKRWISCHQGPG